MKEDIIVVDGITVDKNSPSWRAHVRIATYYRANITEEEMIKNYVKIEKELQLEKMAEESQEKNQETK